MKYWILGLLVLSTVGLGAFIVNRSGGDVRQVGDTLADSSTTAELDVEPFMRNVDRLKGLVKVIGVVNTTSSDEHMLTLLDQREFEECGVTTCAALYLPVRWSGEMPCNGETVRIEGLTQDETGKLVFVAQKLERVRKP